MKWPPELKLSFPERGGWLLLPPVSLPTALLPPSLLVCSFGGSASAAAAASAASEPSLSRERASGLPAATATLGKLAGFRLPASERELPTCHSVSLSRGSPRGGGSARTQTLPDAKGDETTAEFTRRVRALPRQQPTGTFSPLGKLEKKIFLSYLAAVSNSSSPSTPLPNALAFLRKSGQNWASLLIAARVGVGGRPKVFRQADIACAPSQVCSPLNCKGIKFSSSCLYWDWEEGEGACWRVGEGERGKERREERGGGRGRREGGSEGWDREGAGREAAISSPNRAQRCRSQCSDMRAECR